MPPVAPSFFGFLLLLFGLAAALLTLVLLRAIYLTHPSVQTTPILAPSIDVPNHAEAILIILQGGRLGYLNRQAREWFNTWEETPSLERVSRRINPTETFLSLCSTEGELRLFLDGRAVDAKSYTIPYAGTEAMLIALQQPHIVLDLASEQPAAAGAVTASQAFHILSNLSQAMSASLDLESTVQAILVNVERIIHADFAEITIWDSLGNNLIPYRLIGIHETEPRLEKSNERYTSDSGFSGYLITEQKPLLVEDVEAIHRVKPVINRREIPINSYLGIPLLVAGDLIGTLELASLYKEAFSHNDLDLLQMLTGTASFALHNSLLYRTEQQRGKELAGLAQLTQAASALGDSRNLYARLLESIYPLLDVEFLGFLTFNENRKTLQGQLPFIGLHEDIIEWASSVIQPGSRAEAIWLSQEMVITNDAVSDPRFQALGLDHLALAAGVHRTALVPLTSSGRILGYLQVGEKRDGTAFNQDDLRLLVIIAGQAGSIIENAALMQQSEHRAQRAETLRRIASLTGSTATLDEVLKYSIQDLGRLLKADKAAVFLLDERRGELRLHKNSLFGISPEFAARMGRILIDDPRFRTTVISSQNYYLSDNILEDPKLADIYRPLLISLGLKSVAIAPLLLRERGLGEILIGSYETNFFVQGDIQTLITAAGQLASVVERSMLYAQTDETLRRRVDQLTALTRVGRELNNSQDLQHLLQRVYEESLLATRADCGTIMLLETNSSPKDISNAELPEMGKARIMLHIGDPPIPGLGALEKRVLQTEESLIVDDYEAIASAEAETGDYSSPALIHEGVRSSLIVPIAYQERIAGLIHLHSITPNRFDQAAREITEALAIQAAVALGSAYRFQEQDRRSEMLNRRLETLARLLETSQSLQSEQSLEAALENIAAAIQGATQFNTVLISVYDQDSGSLRRTAGAGIPETAATELWTHPQPYSSLQQLLTPEFRLGRSYFIPHERMPILPADIHTITILSLGTEEMKTTADCWHPDDVMVIPLENPAGELLGLISVDDPRDNLRPNQSTIETLEVFASQAALVIYNQRRVNSLKERLLDIQDDLKRAEHAAQTAQSHLPVLLHKDLEQTISVQRLSQRTARIRAGMDIAENVNRQGDRSSVLMVFVREILTHMDLDIGIVVEPGPHGPHLLHCMGRIPSGINIEALIGQRNPLYQSLQTGENILVSRLEVGSEWSNSPLLQAMDSRGFIAIPIFLGARIDSAILAISQNPLPPFTPEDEQSFTLLSRLVAITLQNLNLLTEISQHLAEVNLLLDFNRQLSNLEPDRILQTLVESALHIIPNAQASLAAIWDAQQSCLVPQAASGYLNNERIMEITYQLGEALPGSVFAQQQAIRVDEIDFPTVYPLSSDNLMRYHDATGGKLPISCMVVPIQRALNSEVLGVLCLENYNTPAAFNIETQALVVSLTQQTALNLENSRLYRAAKQRASQLQALAGVAAIITKNLRPDELVEPLLDQLYAILPFNTGTLWLRQGDNLIVRVARGFVDSDERKGLSVAIEDSALLKEMIATGQPIVVGDVNQDERFSSLVENPNPSWLGLPLIASGEVIGVIALEMSEAHYYTSEYVQIASTFASQTAVALENANLYQQSVDRAAELDQRSQRLEMLNRFSKALSQSLDPAELIQITMAEILQTTHCSSVSVILFSAEGQAIVQAQLPEQPADVTLSLPTTPLFDRLRQTLGLFNTENVYSEEELAPLADFLKGLGTQSLLALSLATGNDLHGVIFAHANQTYHFTADEIGLAKTISNQAALAIQNARLYAETRSLTNELDQRVKERTEQLAHAHQRTEILLRLITELSASLDLEQVLTRTLKVLNNIIDAEHITVLIARSGEKKLHHLASVGYETPITTQEFYTSLDTDQGLAGWIINQKKPVLIPDIREDPRWVDLPNQTTQYRSTVGVPLMIGGDALGALLFYHRGLNHFSTDQLDLVQAAANQVAIAVNNAELYRLIRDQAEDLGNLVRSQQIETQRTKAILEDVADGVLVTDESMKITLLNDSGESILSLDREQVMGKSLEHFTGLFGRAAQSWMDTIRKWSQNPGDTHTGDTFAEQINLEGDRVVSVHLAPVSLRDVFLGTVSIFRDITHQVEVDKLKSEFVATVSHELRTPMTSIKGYVDILLMGAAGALTDQQVHFLEIVKNNTDRLGILVNDLLDISRIESGRLTLAMQPVDLGYLVEQASGSLRQRSVDEQKPMTIKTDIPRRLPRVDGDPDQVRRVIDNLLENAYYYTEENGQISVRIHQLSGELQVDVQDNGIGIPVDQQPMVFERFYRGEHPFVLATSGTGLGLSIVQHLVEMHNGRIWLQSSGVPGEGSTFSFTLPIHKADSK